MEDVCGNFSLAWGLRTEPTTHSSILTAEMPTRSNRLWQGGPMKWHSNMKCKRTVRKLLLSKQEATVEWLSYSDTLEAGIAVSSTQCKVSVIGDRLLSDWLCQVLYYSH